MKSRDSVRTATTGARFSCRLLLFVAMAATPCLAQNAGAPGPSPGALQNFRSQISGLRPAGEIQDFEFAPYSEGDEDIGVQTILQEKEVEPSLRLQASGSFYWTDNAALTEQNELEDTYFNSYLRADFLPKIKKDLYGNVFVRYESYWYDNNSFLDFDDFETGLGMAGHIKLWGGVSLFGHYSYERVSENTNHTEIFSEHSIDLGFFKPFPIDSKQFAFLRVESDFGIDADPGVLRRNEYSGVLGYRYKFSNQVSLDAYYRLRYFDYRSQSGNDWNHQPGVSLSYDPMDWLRLAASAYITFNDSSRPGGDYTAGNLGGFITLRVSF